MSNKYFKVSEHEGYQSENLLSFSETLKKFNESIKCDTVIIDRIIRDTQLIQERTVNPSLQDDLQTYIKWISSKSTLKLICADTPKEILTNAKLIDVRINSHGPDDTVYDNDPEIRAKIARGNCIMETSDANGKTYDLIVFALRKFTGGLGDEDDMDRDKNDWSNYFLKSISQTEHIIALDKANGEAAHLSCRYIDGSFLVCAGSKNVHLLFRTSDDIEQHYKNSRYQVAKQVSMTISKYLNGLDKSTRELLLSFLCHTKLTVVFEILQPDNQHIEDLSNLNEPLLKFITFTETKIYTNPSTLCAYVPHHALEIAKMFGISTVKYEKLALYEIDSYMVKVRQAVGYEGVVMYFLDSDMNTVGLLKKKTTWYIVIRAIREKLRSYLSPNRKCSVSELKDSIRKRLREIQKWIGFDDNYLTDWSMMSANFADWFVASLNSKRIAREDFYSKFPTLWTKYLNENQIKDHVKMNFKANDMGSEDDSKCTKPKKCYENNPSLNSNEIDQQNVDNRNTKNKLSKNQKRKLNAQMNQNATDLNELTIEEKF